MSSDFVLSYAGYVATIFFFGSDDLGFFNALSIDFLDYTEFKLD
jgi:hypothetical protein